VNGEKGRLLGALPLEWNFHRHPYGTGVTENLLNGPIDLSFWRAHSEYDLETRKDYPSDQWEVLRTDLMCRRRTFVLPIAKVIPTTYGTVPTFIHGQTKPLSQLTSCFRACSTIAGSM
jgi:hypothetical protein